MKKKFSSTLFLLRKQRGLSQKQAAADLGVSQALLSHYEKGIRECGLGFIVKAADYYNVTCDYLLGRTDNPNEYVYADSGAKREDGTIETDRRYNEICNAVESICRLAQSRQNSTVLENTLGYLDHTLYHLLRDLCKSDKDKARFLFSYDKEIAEKLCTAKMQIELAAVEMASAGNKQNTAELSERSSEDIGILIALTHRAEENLTQYK